MKVSSQTLSVLKNFSEINENILVKPGNTITTISTLKNVLAQATIDEKFEQEYTSAWKAGGKDYDQGGVMNPVAEFTGNELIINNQAEVEAGIKDNNAARAAAPIRLAMERGLYTPGEETHQNNPMPVDDKGFIYTKGGKLPFRVRKGAGIYDHATDQFKKDMTDEQIMAVAKKNINKWEKNNMN